jgi:hypothetical protein
MYSDWQSVGVVFSYKQSGQPGPITRVMCCTPEQAAKYPKQMLSLVPTHFAPSMTVHPRTGAPPPLPPPPRAARGRPAPPPGAVPPAS